MEGKNPIQVADRLFQALELLADQGPLGLMELSTALKLNKSTAHRIVSSLQYMGYVKQNSDNAKYELTFKIVDLSSKVMRKVDVVNIVRPYLRRLMELSGETVHFVERDGTDAVYIDKVECYRNSVQMVSWIGSRIPLYRSGVGKAMAAAMNRATSRILAEKRSSSTKPANSGKTRPVAMQPHSSQSQNRYLKNSLMQPHLPRPWYKQNNV